MIENYLTSIRQQFAYYKMLGDKTFDQLSEADIHWRFNEESNSIAVIVQHLCGNMRSRWTDFLTTDGEKEWRHRDTEFEDHIKDMAELRAKWAEGWQCLFAALDTIHPDNFQTVVYIRNQGHSILEAINRQLAHYPYHVGQIVYIGRMIRGKDWKNLSIPKGKSEDFNRKKFTQPKRREHYTQEFLDKKTEKDQE